ncbi:MAG: DUF937 domain-containing protein [Pseudomonadota bacterium]
MSLLNMLRSAQGGQGLAELARKLNMEQSQAEGLAEMLAPTIGRAARRRADNGDAHSVLGQFQGEAMGSYFDRPAEAAAPEAKAQGANFLEQILGSRDASDELARAAAERSGADQNQVAQFLPALAAMLQGGMQKQTPDNDIAGLLGQLGAGTSGGGGGIAGMLGGLLGGGGSGQKSGGGSVLGGLAQMLDADGDGSPLDDILERVMR